MHQLHKAEVFINTLINYEMLKINKVEFVFLTNDFEEVIWSFNAFIPINRKLLIMQHLCLLCLNIFL